MSGLVFGLFHLNINQFCYAFVIGVVFAFSVEQSVQAKLAVKDEYIFDFAELSPEYAEHELEMQLVNNIRAFLIEMGGDYTFIGNQYHLMAGSRDY